MVYSYLYFYCFFFVMEDYLICISIDFFSLFGAFLFALRDVLALPPSKTHQTFLPLPRQISTCLYLSWPTGLPWIFSHLPLRTCSVN